MVNTVVTFANNLLPLPMDEEKNNRIRWKSVSPWIYFTLALILVLFILLPTIFSMRTEAKDFVYHLLLIVHSTFLCSFFLSTAINRNFADGFMTIFSLLLLLIYKTIHYLIRLRFCQSEVRKDFLLSTLQLTLVFLLVICFILWTFFLIRSKNRTNPSSMEDRQRRAFYSLLAVDLMLTISSFVVNLNNADRFDREDILLLSIGVPLAAVWSLLGFLMSRYKNCWCISTFYIFSLLQPFYLAHLAIRKIYGWNSFLRNDEDFFQCLPLFLISFVCLCCNFLIHLFTLFTGCWMISETDVKLIALIMSQRNRNDSINIDDIDDMMDNEETSRPSENRSTTTDTTAAGPSNRLQSQLVTTSSIVVQTVQQTSLSMAKSQSNVQQETLKFKVKTSNVPGPVGLLPIIKTVEELKDVKTNTIARETIFADEENLQVKRSKRSSELFSLDIHNYPSYAIALQQLRNNFNCEPITIKTALVKARLGIKKRIPLICAAVTNYDRQENTILLDNTGHIRATFIGDDESFDQYNIRVGHTLVLRNVAVFTATRHRHHYVNIHLQNIIAIQDPLSDLLTLPMLKENLTITKSILCSIENELSAYGDMSRTQNETFQIFSQSDSNEQEQNPTKKTNKPSNSNAFSHIQTSSSSVTKFPVISKSTTVESNANNEVDVDLQDEFFSSWD